MLPAYFANMAPVLVQKINLFAYPVDFNQKMNNKPIFGKNKTFRGFIFGIIFVSFAPGVVYVSTIVPWFAVLIISLFFFANDSWLFAEGYGEIYET